MRLRVFLLSCFLAGCSFSPRDIGNANRITLEPVSIKTCHFSHDSLTVSYPQVPDTLNTYRVALSDVGSRTDYYAGMRWTDFLPDTLQAVLVETLLRTRSYDAVITDRVPNANQWRLETDVQQFHAVYQLNSNVPDIHIKMLFRLRNIAKPELTKTVAADKTLRAEGEDSSAIRAAFQHSFNIVQQDALGRLLCSTKK